MAKLDYQESVVSKMVKSHPELRFASKAISPARIFGSSSPTMAGVGLSGKIGSGCPNSSSPSLKQSKVMKAMKFMMNRIGG